MILLATQPRSGSTLLLRLINSCEGALLCGENGGGLVHLLNFLKFGVKHRQFQFCKGRSYQEMIEANHFPAWFHKFDEAQMEQLTQNLIEQYLNPEGSRFFGCKEILFGIGKYEDFCEHITLLRLLFPQLKIIFGTRDLNEIAQSCQKTFKTIPDYLETQRENFDLFAKDNPEFCQILHFDQLHSYEVVRDTFLRVNLNLVLTREAHSNTLDVKLGQCPRT